MHSIYSRDINWSIPCRQHYSFSERHSIDEEAKPPPDNGIGIEGILVQVLSELTWSQYLVYQSAVIVRRHVNRPCRQLMSIPPPCSRPASSPTLSRLLIREPALGDVGIRSTGGK